MNQFTQNLKNAKAFDVGLRGTIRRTIMMLFFLFLTTASLFASHFRYGLLTATRLSETSTTVTYRLNSSQSWRLGTGAGEANSPFVISGGNTGGFTINHTTVTDPSGGWDNNSGTFVVTLNKAITATKIRYFDCCKISNFANNADGSWDQYIILNTNAPGSSPVSSLPAVINLPFNVAAATFPIPVTDPDAGSSFSFGTSLVGTNLAGQTQPSGFSVNAATGLATLNTVGKTVGQIYNAMVTVTDNDGNQIFLDFAILIVGASTPPVFVYPPTPNNGFVYNVGPGTNLTFPISATDADQGSTVNLSVAGLPAFLTTANFSPAFPATGNPSTTNFSWTPTLAQLGTTTVLNFIATDNVGVQTTTSVTINVINAFQCSYNSNGTLTVPPGVTSGTYRLWGAGGGSGLTSGSAASGGGGGGGYTQVNRINLIPGSTFPVTVGAGGVSGSDGGFSQIEGAIASGGKSGSTTGIGGFGGGQTSPFNTVPGGANFPSGFSFKGGDGGAASSPFILGGGGGGSSASATADGNNGTTSSTSSPTGGAGGATNGGNGGNQGSNGNNGTAIGGGAGGRGNGATTVGGNGANGQLDITWNCGTLTSISYTSPTVCSYANPLTVTIVPATSTGGTFSSPTLGAFLNASTGAIAPGAPQGTHVITYGWAAFCTCPAQSVTFTLVIAPQAVATGFTYGGPHCTSVASVSPVFTTLSGVPGVYTSTTGLTLNATTGVIAPATSTPGTYTVTYTVAANGNCNAVTAFTSVTITALPTITNFDYPPTGTPNRYCAGAGIQLPTSSVTNPNNNTISYSYTTSPGLTLNTTTGAIDPATSTPGVYIVTMTIAAGAGCAAVTATSTVEILARPTATIAYTGNPFCQTVNSTSQVVTITGVTGGPLTTVDFTATPAGLTINSTNGTINLNSTPGVYTVKYRFTGANGCLDSSSTTVTIRSRPSSTISYSGANPICSNVSPIVSGTVTAASNWTLTLSNGQTTTGLSGTNVPWSIVVNTLNPGQTVTYSVTSVVSQFCSAVAIPDMPGSVTITKRTTTSGSIPTAANIKVCEGLDASINVTLTSPAQCAPTPQFSGVFKIEKWNGSSWIFQNNYPWTITVGPSTTGIAAAISIPPSNFPNPTSTTLLYRVSWVSLVDCNGCSADPLTGSVVIESVPTADITVSASPVGDVCPGTNIVFTVNQTTTIPNAVFNWEATDAAGNILGSGSNVSFGTNAVNTNLGLSCPFNGLVTFTFNSINPNCCACTGAPIIRTVMVRDIVKPTWITAIGSLNQTLQCSNTAGIAAAQALFPVATDNCDNNVTNIVEIAGAFVPSTTCPQAGTFTNTWTVTDDCNNVSLVFTQVITIIDTQAPTWVTAPTALNQTLQCSNTAGIAAAQALFPVAVDNCDASVTNLVKVSGAFVASTTCPQAGTFTNTWTVRDDCQNLSAVFTQVITVIDNTAPVLTGIFPAGAIEINGCIGSAPVGPTAAAIALLYTDNCGTVVVTKSGTPTGTNCAWSVTYTYLIKDNCGNTVVPSPTITYSGGDVSAPVFTNIIPTQIINTGAGVNCSGIMPDYRPLANVTDCGTFILEQLAPNAPGTMVFGFNGSRNVVIRATDACGNISTTTFVVELKDLTPPVAICKPFTVILNAAGNGSIVLANINNGSYDNCTPTSQLVFGISQTTFTCVNVGTNNVILTVTDLCFNVSTCTAIVTVVDNTAPVISCFGDTTISKDANCTYTMPDLTFRVNRADACGFNANSVTQSIPVGTIFGASVTSMPVTLTVTDKNGNSSTCTFTINFVDVTPPVIAGCPTNIIVNTGLGNALCSQTATWTPPTATDACIICCSTQPITGNFAPGATFPVGVTTVTYTATDVSGNTSTCSFTVTVIDNTRPLIANCPANVSVNTGVGRTTCNQIATWTEPTATDNCTAAGSLIRTRSHAPGSVFPVGVTTVTYTFADAAGNVSLPCTFTVTVIDNTVPIITCPGNIVNPPINTAGCLATVVTANPTFSDNCQVTRLTWAITGAGITPSATSPTTGINFLGTRTFNFGVTTVTYTATDASGNTATCSYTVSVSRPLSSVISGTSTVQQNNTGTSNILFTTKGGTAPYTIVYTAPAGGFPSAGTQTIITTGTNSSTVGGDINWLVTTVPQSSAIAGVYTYTLVSVTDFYGCVVTPNTTATVTVVTTNYPAPDLTPSIASMGSLLVQPASSSLGYIDLYNVAPNPTTGAVSLEVYNPANFNLVIGSTTTNVGSNAVNNNDFNIVAYPGIGYLITSKPGVVINADAGLKIGFQLVATGSNQTKGKLGIVLVNKTGGIITVVGDNNNSNNSGAETYSIIN